MSSSITTKNSKKIYIKSCQKKIPKSITKQKEKEGKQKYEKEKKLKEKKYTTMMIIMMLVMMTKFNKKSVNVNVIHHDYPPLTHPPTHPPFTHPPPLTQAFSKNLLTRGGLQDSQQRTNINTMKTNIYVVNLPCMHFIMGVIGSEKKKKKNK